MNWPSVWNDAASAAPAHESTASRRTARKSTPPRYHNRARLRLLRGPANPDSRGKNKGAAVAMRGEPERLFAKSTWKASNSSGKTCGHAVRGPSSGGADARAPWSAARPAASTPVDQRRLGRGAARHRLAGGIVVPGRCLGGAQLRPARARPVIRRALSVVDVPDRPLL